MYVSAKLTRTPIKALLLLGCLAVPAAVVTARASVVELPATASGHVARFGSSYYQKHYGFLYYGTYYIYNRWTMRAFLKFELDSLPDTCVLVSAELCYYQYEHSGLPEVNIRLIQDPVPMGASTIYQLMDQAKSLTTYAAWPDGWVEWQFDSSGISALDSCRRTGSASFGIHYAGSTGSLEAYAYGSDGAEPPYLRIEYTVSGTCEPQGPAVRQPELAFAPNPANGRFVIVRYTLAAGTRGKLTLRDVLGRTAKSFTLNPSGSTRLDLRGFPPGIYMATIDAAGQSITRKLVLTAPR